MPGLADFQTCPADLAWKSSSTILDLLQFFVTGPGSVRTLAERAHLFPFGDGLRDLLLLVGCRPMLSPMTTYDGQGGVQVCVHCLLYTSPSPRD